MNDDLQPLALLLAQAERQRYDALAEQLKAETAKRAAVSQAEQLVAYRREYEQRWSTQFCQEGKIELDDPVAKYIPDMEAARKSAAEGGAGAAALDPVPIIMNGLQEELGLKLESRKVPLDLLIIDRAEKVPTEN